MKQPSGTLEQRAARVLSPVLGHYTWLEVDRGEGSWLITRDGKRILDLTCGIAVTPVGHAHPKVVAAVQAQAAKLAHICAGVAAYEPNIALAEYCALENYKSNACPLCKAGIPITRF